MRVNAKTKQKDFPTGREISARSSLARRSFAET